MVASGGSRSTMRVFAATGACTFLLVVLGACAQATGPAPAPRPAAPVPVSDIAERGLGDGTWLVGTDLQLGSYRSAGAMQGRPGNCAWATRSGPTGNSRVIDSGSAGIAESMTVQIHQAVKAFTSTNCEPWLKVG